MKTSCEFTDCVNTGGGGAVFVSEEPKQAAL